MPLSPDAVRPEPRANPPSNQTTNTTALATAVIIFAGLNLAIFLLRAVSVIRYGSLFGTTGGECLMVYSIWKKMHAYAVYEWPLTRPFSLSLYNYLFYYTYAEVFRILGWWDAQILTLGRMLTAAFAAIGALAQWQLVKTHISLRTHKYLCLALCLGLWFSTSVVRWWALTIRPDVPAIALVAIALLCLGRVSGEKAAVLAAVFFYLAWSFKQSIALIAAAAILYMLATRRRSGLVMLGVFGGAIAATYWLGTEAYRYSVFVAPRIVPSFSFSYAISSLKQPSFTYGYFLIPLCALLARPWKRAFEISDLLRACALVALVGGCIAMGKTGAGDNYLFEVFLAGTTLLLMELFSNPSRKAAVVFILLGCVQPAVQLEGWLVGRQTFGAIEIANRLDFAEAQEVQHQVVQSKMPMLTTDETMSLPWNSSNNSYPAYVFDPVFAQGAAARYVEGGPTGLISRGEVPTLMLKPTDIDLYRAAEGKYDQAGKVTHQHFHYDLFVIKPNTK